MSYYKNLIKLLDSRGYESEIKKSVIYINRKKVDHIVDSYNVNDLKQNFKDAKSASTFLINRYEYLYVKELDIEERIKLRNEKINKLLGGEL